MPRPRTDIRPRILKSARERFAASGVDATSLRSIASDAGTSIGMIYYYFPTKDDLFLAVVEEVYAALLSDLEQALSAHPDFESSVNALYRRVAGASALELQVIRLVAREALTSGQRLKSLVQRMSRGHVPLIFKTVGRGLTRGELRRELHPAVLMAATLALGTLPQIALRVLGAHLPVTPPAREVLTEQLADALLNGIGSKGIGERQRR
jgi:TetR/AcrR family transcriptional regulator